MNNYNLGHRTLFITKHIKDNMIINICYVVESRQGHLNVLQFGNLDDKLYVYFGGITQVEYYGGINQQEYYGFINNLKYYEFENQFEFEESTPKALAKT